MRFSNTREEKELNRPIREKRLVLQPGTTGKALLQPTRLLPGQKAVLPPLREETAGRLPAQAPTAAAHRRTLPRTAAAHR